MSNNQKEQQEPEKNQEEKNAYQKSLEEERNKIIDKALKRIDREREEMDETSRFGYFSIPYPATVGDKAYSQKKEYHHKIVEGKVITEKRGIFTQPPKKGKGNDVYFEPIEPVSKETIEKFKKMNYDEIQNHRKEILEKKENKVVLPHFVPAGPQPLKGFYESDEKYVPNGPLTKEKNRFKYIKDGRVVTEKRGIYSSASKIGPNPIPVDFFSYPFLDKELLNQYQKIEVEERKQDIIKKRSKSTIKSYKKPFAPASLKKNECFSSIPETYGAYDQETIKKRLEEYSEIKKMGKPKYQKCVPKGSFHHDKPFIPPKLISTGRDALFNDDLYKIPTQQLKRNQSEKVLSLRERRERENKNRRNPFTYNKLMNQSTFSPPINSFAINIKREFPSVFFK